MSTKAWLSTTAADSAVTVGSDTKKLATTTQTGGTNTQVVKQTVNGPSSPVQMTDGSGTTDGTTISWYTQPLGAITIAGAISWSIYTLESAAQANAALCIRVERCLNDGTVQSTIAAETINQAATEMVTTTAANQTGSFTAAQVTDTALNAGDRLRISLWIDDAADQGGTGSMASGRNGKAFYGASSGVQ